MRHDKSIQVGLLKDTNQMDIGVVTLFPGMFSALSEYGITGRAVRNKLLQLRYWNPRDYASDRHRTVDDRPYGGGPGMVMRTGPVGDAIIAARAALGAGSNKPAGSSKHVGVIYLSPQGKPLDQQTVAKLAQRENMVLLCGRYEGVDERVLTSLVDEEYSLGDFILSGGELAAMALLDAMTRLLPGALGDAESARQDSFSGTLPGSVEGLSESVMAGAVVASGEIVASGSIKTNAVPGLLDHPHYTRPENYAGMLVPPVLLSGDHAEINRWRLQQRLGATWRKRPDLLEGVQLTAEQLKLLDEYKKTSK
jgi:tRNA (guanine37-N1)-methyltransferase